MDGYFGVGAVRFGTLSEREQQIMQEIVKGRQNKEIAKILGIVEGTVKVHIKTILKKCGARTRTEAVYKLVILDRTEGAVADLIAQVTRDAEAMAREFAGPL